MHTQSELVAKPKKPNAPVECKFIQLFATAINMQINSACDRTFRAKNKLSTSISNNYNSLHSRIQIRFHENQMKSQAMSTLTFCSSYSKVKN